MKTIFFMGATTALLMAFSFLTAYSQVDLSVRQAIYFTGKDTSGKDMLQMPSATPEYTLELKDSQAVSCDGKTCKFNLGVLVWRDAGKGTFSKEIGRAHV